MIDDLRHFRSSRPRRVEYFWAAIAVLLYALGSAGLLEEEGARRASANRLPPDLFVDDPRELPQRKYSYPLGCLPPKGEWILQWGDGQLPGKTREASPRCVNADLRRRAYVP